MFASTSRLRPINMLRPAHAAASLSPPSFTFLAAFSSFSSHPCSSPLFLGNISRSSSLRGTAFIQYAGYMTLPLQAKNIPSMDLSTIKVAKRMAHMERAGKCVRPGLVIMLPGSEAPIPHRVVKFVHGKRGKGGGFVRSTLKNLITGQVYEKTFTADENLTIGDLEKFAAQYSWNDGSTYYFIQNRTFDEIKIAAEDVDCIDFLVEGIECNLSVNDGTVLAVEVPLTAEFVVTAVENTEHGKRARIANVVLSVPEFVDVGDKIKVNTVEREYLAKIL